MKKLSNLIFISFNEYKQNIETNASGDMSLVLKQKVSKYRNREKLKEYDDRFMFNAY